MLGLPSGFVAQSGCRWGAGMIGRRRLVRVTVLGVLVALSGTAASVWAQRSADLLTEVSQRLDSSVVLRGEFEQTKTLKGFRRPLVSRGSFVMSRGQGVQWVTREPFASTLVVTRERLVTLTGSTAQQIDTRHEPGLRTINDMLMALLSGDVKALAGRFSVEGRLQGAQAWSVDLTPRDAALAGFIAHISLQGDHQVNEVRLTEASGDDSRIHFFNQTSSALTQAEAERFH